MASSQMINREGYTSPYLSEAVIYKDTVYCSGKIGLDVETGELVSDDMGKQTVRISLQGCRPSLTLTPRTQEAALKLMELVLRAAGSDLSKLLKVNAIQSHFPVSIQSGNRETRSTSPSRTGLSLPL
jgi:enamine deaminase RidA (YjgF/YER057c/UK114 family)